MDRMWIIVNVGRFKHLFILDKDERPEELEKLRALSAETQLHFYKFDVTSDKLVLQEILDEILKIIDAIDIFIYGAGICNDQLFETTVQVNFTGFVKAVGVIMPHMDKRNGGRGGTILSIASMSGLDPIAFLPVYSATKSAIIAFTRALGHAKMLQQTNVRFISVCPGGTKTPIQKTARNFFGLKIDQNDASRPDDRNQEADVCAKNLVKAIEIGQSGAIWMLDVGEMELMEPQHYWEVPKIIEGYIG